jgi:hypothetical protein
MSEVGNKEEGIRSWNRQESAPVVPIEREQLRFLLRGVDAGVPVDFGTQ